MCHPLQNPCFRGNRQTAGQGTEPGARKAGAGEAPVLGPTGGPLSCFLEAATVQASWEGQKVGRQVLWPHGLCHHCMWGQP